MKFIVEFIECYPSLFDEKSYRVDIYPDIENTKAHFEPLRFKHGRYKKKETAIKYWKVFANEHSIEWKEIGGDL